LRLGSRRAAARPARAAGGLSWAGAAGRSRVWAALVAATLLFVRPPAAEPSIVVNDVIQVRATNASLFNCIQLRDVLDGIDDASQAHRYVVLLEPGFYECGEEVVAVPEGVTLRGLAGPRHVRIQGVVDSALIGVVHLFPYAKLESVWVQNAAVSPASGAIAVSAWDLGAASAGIELQEVVLGVSATAKRYSLYAEAAEVSVTEAELQDPLLAAAGSQIEISYSLLGQASATGGSTLHCFLAREVAVNAPVDSACQAL
jgi:hypothetical protein